MASESGEEENSDPSFHLDAVMMDHCYSVLHEEYTRRFRLTEETESPKEEECNKSVETFAPIPGALSKEQVKNDSDKVVIEQTRNEESLDDNEGKEEVDEKKNETEDFLEVPVQTRRQKKKLEEIMTGNLSPERLEKDGFCKMVEPDGAKLHSPNKGTRPLLTKNREDISNEPPTTPKKRGRPRKNTVSNQKESEERLEKTEVKEEKTMADSGVVRSPRGRGRPRRSSVQLTVYESTAVVRKTQVTSGTPLPVNKESQEQKYEYQEQNDVGKQNETEEFRQEDEVSSTKMEQKGVSLSPKLEQDKNTSESRSLEQVEHEDNENKASFKQTTKSKTKQQSKKGDKNEDKHTKSGDKDGTRKEETKSEKVKEQKAESSQSKTKTTKKKLVRRESRTLSVEALAIEPSLFSNPDVMIKDSVGGHVENQSESDTKLQATPKIPSIKKEDSEESPDKTNLACQVDDNPVARALKYEDVLHGTNPLKTESPNLDESQHPCGSIEESSSCQLKSTFENTQSVENEKDTEAFESDVKEDKDNEKITQECERVNSSNEDQKVTTGDESVSDDSSEDDPDRLWCICRKPHNGRFMIGCDGCEEWFHGSCVGITRQKGQLMEKEEIEWLCPKCKEEQDSEVKWTQTTEVKDVGSNSETNVRFVEKDDDKDTKKEEVKTVKKEDVKAVKKDMKKGDMKKEDVKSVKVTKKDDIKKEDSKTVRKKDVKAVKVVKTEKYDVKSVKDEWFKTVKKDSVEVPQREGDVKTEKHGVTVKRVDTKSSRKEEPRSVKDESKSSVLYHSPLSKPLDNTVKSKKKADRKCVECKKLVTIPGIFCSLECLEKHVKESLEAITLERERKKEPPIKPSEHRILVLEHDSGKLLAGPHAPLAEHLFEWLKVNPTFQILRPRHISMPKDSFIKKDGDQVKDDEGLVSPEPIRLNVRKTLLECLSARLKTAEIFCVSSEEIKDIAVKIEEELFRYFKDTGSKYKAKYRSLIFNIRDHRNEGLFRKIVKSVISPEKLVRMSPGEMASKELVKWREQETKHTLEIIKREQMEQVNNPHHTKKTHKGEIEIEEESLVTLDQQKNMEKELVSSTLGTPVIMSADTASPGTPVDTTDQHRSHLFDLSCKICTGKVAPPLKEPVVKKVHVAHTIAVETKEKPSSTKTDLDIRIAEILRQGELEFVKERHKRSEKNKHKKDIVEEKSDQEPSSTVSFGSPDSGSTTCSQIKPSRTQPSVWKGFIYMQDVAKFVTSAYKVSGPTDFLTQDIPDTVQVCGRVTQEQIWDYLGRTKQSGNKELIVIRFQPANDEEKVPYGAFYSYLNSRKRFGVVGNASKMIKDFYILPLPSYSPVPTVLMPFDGPGLSPSRPHILLGVIVRHKNRPLRQVTESHLHMENADPYEPSYTPPLETFPDEKTPKLTDDHFNTFHTSAIRKRSVSDSGDPTRTPPVEKLSREDDFEDVAISQSRESNFGVSQPVGSCDRDKPETWKNRASLTRSSSATEQFPNSVQTRLEHSPLSSHHKENLETEKTEVEQPNFQGVGHTLGTIQGPINQNVTCSSSHQISATPSLVTNKVCSSQKTVESNIGSEQHLKKETTEGIDDIFTKLSSGLPPNLRTIIKAINKVTQQFTSGTLATQNVGQNTGKTSSVSESQEKVSRVSVEESRQETSFNSDKNKLHQSVLSTKIQDQRTRVQTTDNNVVHSSPHVIPPVGEPISLPQHAPPVIPANNSSLPYKPTPLPFNDPNGGAERSSLPLPPRKTPLVEPLPPGVDPEELENSLTSPSFPLVPCLPGPVGTTLGPRLPPAPPCNATVQPPLPPCDPPGLNYPRPPHFGNPFPSPNIYRQPVRPQFCPPLQQQQQQMGGYNSFRHPFGGVGEHYLANSTTNRASFGNVPRHPNPAEWPTNWRPRPWGSNNMWNEQEQMRRQEYKHGRGGGEGNWRLKDKRKHYQSYEGSNGSKRRKHD